LSPFLAVLVVPTMITAETAAFILTVAVLMTVLATV
jgi:hypothetical protein